MPGLSALLALLLALPAAWACTSIIVGREATTDGALPPPVPLPPRWIPPAWHVLTCAPLPGRRLQAAC